MILEVVRLQLLSDTQAVSFLSSNTSTSCVIVGPLIWCRRALLVTTCCSHWRCTSIELWYVMLLGDIQRSPLTVLHSRLYSTSKSWSVTQKAVVCCRKFSWIRIINEHRPPMTWPIRLVCCNRLQSVEPSIWTLWKQGFRTTVVIRVWKMHVHIVE